ncbi:hypothetical protein PENTCL1PPCAC_24560, partial [Pristionchus entomophagus]
MNECEKITPQALHQVYKSMIEGSTKLRSFYVDHMRPEKCIAFLNLIGINYKDGRFYSNRDIEVYEITVTYEVFDDKQLFNYSIFDGHLQIECAPVAIDHNDVCPFALTLNKSIEDTKNEVQEDFDINDEPVEVARIDILPAYKVLLLIHTSSQLFHPPSHFSSNSICNLPFCLIDLL